MELQLETILPYLISPYAILAYGILTVVLMILYWNRQKQKILIRIHKPTGEKHKWMLPESDGKTFIMERGNVKGKPIWQFNAEGCIFPLPNRRLCVDVNYHADKAVKWSSLPANPNEIPTWDKESAWRFITAKVLQLRYKEGPQKLQENPMFWIIIMIAIGSLIVNIWTGYKLGVFK